MAYGGNGALQLSLRNWISLNPWASPFAVTLTLRQCVNVPNGFSSAKLWLNETAQLEQTSQEIANILAELAAQGSTLGKELHHIN